MAKGKKPKDDSFYRKLGVDPSMTSEEIKKKTRRKVADAHPDQAGNSETALARFHDLHKAYETLTDDARREHYDETGETIGTQENEAQRLQRELWENVFALFTQTLDVLASKGIDPKFTDLITTMKNVADQVTLQTKDEIKKVKKSQDVMRKTVKRIKRKDKRTGEDDPFVLVIESSIQGMDRVVADLEKKIKRHNEVRAFLDEYTFETEKMPSKDFRSMFSSGGTTFKWSND